MKAASASRRLRTYAHTLVTTGVVLVFAFIEWWTEKLLADRSRVASTVVEIVIVLVATLAFRPIHQRVENAVEAVFTKRKREARAALVRLRAELTSFNDANQLLRRVVEALHQHAGAIGCAVYLRRDTYRAEASSFDAPAPNIEIDDPLAIRLRTTASPADPRALHSRAAGDTAFPMTAGGELIGFLSLTPKPGEFEPDDAHFVGAFAEALGLALLALDPDLRVGDAAARSNLPADPGILIGREHELFEVNELFSNARLVTITGPGGIGKTRVALHAASAMRTGDGAWLADLAPLTDASLVPGAIAHALNIGDEGGSRPLVESIARALQRKHLLIVLDNCEHVIASAADTVSHLLKSCPGVRILATSREPLGVAGEQQYHLSALPVPPGDEHLTAERVLSFGAAALFVERARSAHRGFVLTDENAGTVAAIVRRLDGIPLAIELAAPRVKVLSLDRVAAHLDERLASLAGGSRVAQPRHQTLRALIGWSYDLLNGAEQAVLRRSAIFRGTWTLEALEACCSEMPAADVLQHLLALVEKSLVAVETDDDERRYRLLESTHAFASERLDEAGERASAAAQHGAYFRTIAMHHGAAYWQTDSGTWSAGVRSDLQNLRAAVNWGLSGADVAAAAEIVASLRWFWYTISRREGRTLLERAHKICGEPEDVRLRGLLALAAATLDYSAQAVFPASEAVATLRGIDALGYAEALTFEAVALGRGGRIDEAIGIFEKALDGARSTRAPRLIGWVLSMVAYWIGAANDHVRARGLFDEAAELLRACDDAWQLARLQLHRAEFLYAQGDPHGALAGVREAEAVFRERHGESGLCVSVLNAAAYLIALARLDEAWECAREGLELALRLDTSMPGAWAFGHLARLAAETGDPERAARLLGFADAAYHATGSTREPTEQTGYDRTLELIRSLLPEHQVAALMLEGARLEQDVAVAHANEIPQPGKPAPDLGVQAVPS